MNSPKVSIVMRSKNSDWVIGRALSALFSQEFRDFELLVVDSGSTDTTLDIVKNYPCRLVQIPAGDYYPGKVLNDAIKQCSSELIVFINSDSVMLTPQSLGNLVEAFDKEDLAGAFGRQLPRPEAHNWVRRDYALSFPESGDAPAWITLSLPLAAIRRSVWERRPFYTDSWASEDTEWGNWARNAGLNVKYVPTATTMHSHNYTLKEIYGRRFVEGEADVFIHNKKVNVLSMTLMFLKVLLQDWKFHLKLRDFLGCMQSVPRRLTYQWAYMKGNQLGWSRRLSNSSNTSIGQQIVLNSVGK